ncbi:hypothetical protein KQX54_005215 [Cotesia glomerata]|uniref:Uncharacterized protein n=1 Tax=Cotesia glomerata TaxID=32391 RepID=A0AAV7ID00_COTGL|nr:hypothetical protein KQX54_005215 [Cotesia glomerata]
MVTFRNFSSTVYTKGFGFSPQSPAAYRRIVFKYKKRTNRSYEESRITRNEEADIEVVECMSMAIVKMTIDIAIKSRVGNPRVIIIPPLIRLGETPMGQ